MNESDAGVPAAHLNPTRSFREAMAQLGAAVTIITTDGPGGRAGVTATAVSSVTDSPPTLLVCVNRDSATNAAIKANGVLAVNVLAAEDESVACHFAGMTRLPMNERFGKAEWRSGVAGGPALLVSALATLCGRVVHTLEVGSHSVFFCQLDTIKVSDGADSLVYFARRFRRVVRTERNIEIPDHMSQSTDWV